MTGSALRMWARVGSADAAAAGNGASRQGRSSTRTRCACLLAALWHSGPEAIIEHADCVHAAAQAGVAACWPEAVFVAELASYGSGALRCGSTCEAGTCCERVQLAASISTASAHKYACLSA